MSGDSARRKVEIKKWYSSYPEWPLVMTNYVAYGVSYPLAGMGYMVDGTLYFIGYAGIFGISCGPGLALAIAAGGGAPDNFNPCFLPVDHAVRTFEREHPKLGKKIWRATADWRHDPWDVYIENQAVADQ